MDGRVKSLLRALLETKGHVAWYLQKLMASQLAMEKFQHPMFQITTSNCEKTIYGS